MTDYEGDIVGIEPYNVEAADGGEVTPFLFLHVQVSVPLKEYRPSSHKVHVSW